LAEAVAAGQIGGTRFDTMVCDAWLPLLAARIGAGDGAGKRAAGYERLWRDWVPGDAPDELLRLAREFGVGGGEQVGGPLGQGDMQGLLVWLAVWLARSGRGT
jgi:hypothetical protein